MKRQRLGENTGGITQVTGVEFILFAPFITVVMLCFLLVEGGNLAASKIRNLECPSYEICLIDYGCGKFNRKIHIMEQYP